MCGNYSREETIWGNTVCTTYYLPSPSPMTSLLHTAPWNNVLRDVDNRPFWACPQLLRISVTSVKEFLNFFGKNSSHWKKNYYILWIDIVPGWQKLGRIFRNKIFHKLTLSKYAISRSSGNESPLAKYVQICQKMLS